MELIFEWDRSKAESNSRKHEVSFDEAKTVFQDEHLITFADVFHSDNEQRFMSIGASNRNRMLLVVHTEVSKGDEAIVIRLISSRKATPTERKIYESR
jgi:uncharacterized DUF497 family protein